MINPHPGTKSPFLSHMAIPQEKIQVSFRKKAERTSGTLHSQENPKNSGHSQGKWCDGSKEPTLGVGVAAGVTWKE